MAGTVNIVEFYRDARGRCPFLDWFHRLGQQGTRDQIDRQVRRLEDGHDGDGKPVGQGVRELRIHSGPGYRLYYGRQGKRLYLLLCGGDKSSQRRDIARAKAYWQDHKRRVLA